MRMRSYDGYSEECKHFLEENENKFRAEDFDDSTAYCGN